jgi:hypothetical protein
VLRRPFRRRHWGLRGAPTSWSAFPPGRPPYGPRWAWGARLSSPTSPHGRCGHTCPRAQLGRPDDLPTRRPPQWTARPLPSHRRYTRGSSRMTPSGNTSATTSKRSGSSGHRGKIRPRGDTLYTIRTAPREHRRPRTSTRSYGEACPSLRKTAKPCLSGSPALRQRGRGHTYPRDGADQRDVHDALACGDARGGSHGEPWAGEAYGRTSPRDRRSGIWGVLTRCRVPTRGPAPTPPPATRE